MKPATPEAVRLFHEGAIALSAVEHAGIRMDVPYLKRTIEETNKRIKELEDAITEDAVIKAWRKHFGTRTNLDSRDQLGTVLYDILGFGGGTETAGSSARRRRWAVDETALEKINTPFAKQYLEIEKLKKVESTYLRGILREIEGDFLHPSFGLHNVRTFRGSSSNPNFQNIPIRVPEYAKLIRRAFIPRPGHVLVEIDFGQIEVRVAACYHKDPRMLQYISEGYDFHREMAIKCYKLPGLAQVVKDYGDVGLKRLKAARQQAKALFVFAEFYGDYYVKVAQSLWDACTRYGLLAPDGTPMHAHLKAEGISKLGACNPKEKPASGTFERHIKETEDYFWNVMFPVYAKWRRDWHQRYLTHGYFNTLTGFLCQGVYSRNDAVNYPIQGSAFHCLLWSIIQIVKWLRRYKMQSVVVGQIHDSCLIDCHESELEDVLHAANYIMTKALPKHWQWLITPLEVEMDVAATNWYEKQPHKLAA